MAEREFDIYDIRRSSRSPVLDPSVVVPPTAHEIYLWDEAVREKIGATRGNYTLCSMKVYQDFLTTGDGKILSFLVSPSLNLLILLTLSKCQSLTFRI